MIVLLWRAKKIVTQGGAVEIPIPVPEIWHQCVSPHLIRLLRKTISSASIRAVEEIEARAGSVFMLVYIGTALLVKRAALWG